MTSLSLHKSDFLFVRSYSTNAYEHNKIDISLSSSKITNDLDSDFFFLTPISFFRSNSTQFITSIDIFDTKR